MVMRGIYICIVSYKISQEWVTPVHCRDPKGQYDEIPLPRNIEKQVVVGCNRK